MFIRSVLEYQPPRHITDSTEAWEFLEPEPHYVQERVAQCNCGCCVLCESKVPVFAELDFNELDFGG